MKPMRVLVACEFSGIVRDAFAARGFDAWSCDIVPAVKSNWKPVVFSADCDDDGTCPHCGIDFAECDCFGPTQDGVEYRENRGVMYGRYPIQHIREDVLAVLDQGWDLMVAHPPCTYLSYAGTAHWNKPGRKPRRDLAMQFFMACVNAPIRHICVENPFGLPCQDYRKPDQIIDPFQFGHRQRKRTCLWLKNLPPLTPTDVVDPEPHYFIDRGQKKRHWVDSLPPGPMRQRIRSTTFPGIARAMADQWGRYIMEQRTEAA